METKVVNEVVPMPAEESRSRMSLVEGYFDGTGQMSHRASSKKMNKAVSFEKVESQIFENSMMPKESAQMIEEKQDK